MKDAEIKRHKKHPDSFENSPHPRGAALHLCGDGAWAILFCITIECTFMHKISVRSEITNTLESKCVSMSAGPLCFKNHNRMWILTSHNCSFTLKPRWVGLQITIWVKWKHRHAGTPYPGTRMSMAVGEFSMQPGRELLC